MSVIALEDCAHLFQSPEFVQIFAAHLKTMANEYGNLTLTYNNEPIAALLSVETASAVENQLNELEALIRKLAEEQAVKLPEGP